MPNLATALKAEVTRLARKELKPETDSMRKALAACRSDIAALKKRIGALEKQVEKTARAPTGRAKAVVAEEGTEEARTSLRFRAAGMGSNRKRLGLSAADFGRLVGATGQSVYAWEAGKTKPSADKLAAIAALRGVGKQQVAKMLEGLRAD